MTSEVATKYPIGSKPAISIIPYMVVLSHVVSLIGAFTTVELLHRRLSATGWRSWVQLAGCAVSFGLVAIWCMHFVGNRAIVLGDGEEEIQLYYKATYTIASAILPVAIIFLGLLVAGRSYKRSKCTITRFASLLVCGVCAGAAMTEMHYLGNNGTENYRLQSSVPHVVGAASIAVGACLISFGLFFHWSQHWMNNIWRRIVVACFLSFAVSGMHWTAVSGTWYEIQGYHHGSKRKKDINGLIALCLCMCSCAICFLLQFTKQRQRKMMKDRAQQVVLAIATFDPEGRLLVSQSGLMLCQTITQQFHQRTFDDEFNTSHPVFQWIFRVSRNWTSISELIPSMREHLQTTGYLRRNSPSPEGGSRSSFDTEDDSSYSATFRELFCITAHEIAKTLDMSLHNLGYLYEEVLTTGTVSRALGTGNYGNKTIVAADVATLSKDIEAGFANPVLFGRGGQMLVLTRKVDTEEVKRLRNLGYGFASIVRVSDHLARSLQIPRNELEELLDRLHSFSKRETPIPIRGTYIASFLVQAKPSMRGLDVIVPRTNPEMLPMVKLSSGELDSRHHNILAAFNGLSLDACLLRISQLHGKALEDNAFLEKFRNRIMDLLRDCPEQMLHNAMFSAQRHDFTHGMHGQKESIQATLYAFCGIKEIYVQSLQSLTLKTIPLSFFQTYLRSYPGCPDHAILAQKNHKEFSSFQQVSYVTKPAPSQQGSRWLQKLRTTKAAPMDMPFSSSEEGLVDTTSSPTEIPIHPWGGIMVTSTQNMQVDEGEKMEMRDSSVTSDIGMAETEQRTLADRLVLLTTAFRDPHATPTLPKDLYYGRK